MAKVIGIVGSPHPVGNTRYLVNEALETLKAEGIDVEMVRLGDKRIAPCEACYACRQQPGCRIEDDFQEVYEKMVAADGIIVGSPVYFGSAAPQVMALLDRAGFVGMKTRAFNRKAGAAIAVARRAGANFTFAQLNYFFLISGMIVPGSTYWNVGYGFAPEEVKDDEEAIQTVQNLAKNMAWLIKKINA